MDNGGLRARRASGSSVLGLFVVGSVLGTGCFTSSSSGSGGGAMFDAPGGPGFDASSGDDAAPPVDAANPVETGATDAANPGSDASTAHDASSGNDGSASDSGAGLDTGAIDSGVSCSPLSCTPINGPDGGSYTFSCNSTCNSYTLGCQCAADDPAACFCNVGNAAPGCVNGSLSDCGYPQSCSADLSSDPANCGRCGHSCGALTCTGGVCQPQQLSFGDTTVGASTWATDGTYLYVTDCGSGKVFRSPVGGSATPPTTYVTGAVSPMGTAFDASNVYWLQDGNGGTVWSAPVSGAGSPTQLGKYNQQWFSGACNARLASDASSLYFVVEPSAGYGYVYSLPKTGGTPKILANDATIGKGLVGVDATYVYFTAFVGSDGQLRSVPKAAAGDAGIPSTLVATFTGEQLQDLFVGSDGVYVAGYAHAWRVPFGSTTPVVVFDGTVLGGPTNIASDGTTLFMANQAQGFVYAKKLAGGPAQRIALNLFEPYIVLTDATSVYFRATGTGTFLKMPSGYQP